MVTERTRPSIARSKSYPFALSIDVDGQTEWVGDLNPLNNNNNGTGTISGVLTFVIQEDLRSYLRLDLCTQFHLGSDHILKTAKFSIGFDVLTNTSDTVFTRFKNFVSDSKEEVLKELDPENLIPVESLYVAELQYDGTPWVSNLFGFNDFGESNRIVEALRTKLLQPEGRLQVLFSGKSARKVTRRFSAALDAQQDFHPLGAFYTKRYQEMDERPFYGVGNMVPASERPLVVADPLSTFPDVLTYAIHNGTAVIQEAEFMDEGEQISYDTSIKMLMLNPTPEKSFMGFCAVQDVGVTLERGQRLSLTFKDVDTVAYQCVVMSLMANTMGQPVGYVLRSFPVTSAPSSGNKEDENRADSVLDLDGNEVKPRIPDGENLRIHLQSDINDRDVLRQMFALRDIQKSPTRYAEAIQVLLGNTPSRIRKQEFYAKLPGTHREKRQFLTMFLESLPRPFNERQKEAFEALRSIPRIHMIQGPGGTGKSEFATLACQPLLLTSSSSGPKNQILIACGSNNNVDDLAEQAIEHTRLFLPPEREPIVIRLHCYETEMTVFTGDVNWRKLLKPEPIDLDHEVVANLSAAHDLYNLEDELLQVGHLTDSRLVLEYLSLGHYMKRVLGLLGADDPLYVNDGFHDLRALYVQWIEGNLTVKERIAFKTHFEKLQNYVLEKADIVVTTASTTAIPQLHTSPFRACAIFVDEAGRLTEGAIWPLFAYYGTAPIVFLGDRNQTGPVIKTSPKENSFAAQLELPFFTRMLDVGASVTYFTRQHRYPTEVCEVLSKHFYDDQLESGSNVDLHPLIPALRDFNLKNFQRDALMMFIDVPASKCETIAGGTSKVSTLQTTVLLHIVERLLMAGMPASTIGIASPYTAMNRYVISGLHWLATKYPEAPEILAASIDGFTGLERDVMLIALVVGKGLGFLQKTSRICTALTRCKVGFTIIGNLGTMSSSREWADCALGGVVSELVRKGMYATSRVVQPPNEVLRLMPRAMDVDDLAARFRGKGKCYGCGEIGHIRAQCPDSRS